MHAARSCHARWLETGGVLWVLRWLVSPINVQAANVLAKPVTLHVDLSFEEDRSDRTGKSQGSPCFGKK